MINKIQLYLLIGILSIPQLVLGVPSGPPPNNTIKNPLGDGNENLFKFINNVIDAVLKLGAIIAVLAIIYAGFLFVTAQGEEEKITKAKKVLLYAAIGIAILLGARLIANVITGTIKDVNEAAQ